VSRWGGRDESTTLILDPGESGTYLLVFDADHLGKGTRLFLSLPNRVFEVLKDDQIIRFDQAAVEPMPADPVVPASDTKTAPPSVPAGQADAGGGPTTDAKVTALVTQLAKGKTAADRVKAAHAHDDHHLYAAFVAALPKIRNVAGYRFPASRAPTRS